MTQHSHLLYLIAALAPFAMTLVVVPLCRALAWRLDVVDRPGQARKVHQRTIPYLGGLAFYASFLGLMLLLVFVFPQYLSPVFIPMLFVGTLIVLMGIYDDIHDMPSAPKLVIELGFGLLLYFWGFRADVIASPLGGVIDVGWLAIIITPLWIAGVVNAVNFCDGLDGLAAGIVAICSAAIFAIAYKQGQVASCIVMAYLIGTCIGFLRYNFHPASVFMGDTGALFLGFVLGASTLIEQQKGVATIALAVPIVVLAIPIVDTALSFLRRMQRARQGKFFHPDRDHLHHRLLNLGLSQPQVVLSLYYISACMGLLAFILSVVPENYSFLIVVLAAMAIVFGVLVLRFIESFAERNGNGPAAADEAD